jgi:hypothetical protein
MHIEYLRVAHLRAAAIGRSLCFVKGPNCRATPLHARSLRRRVCDAGV